MSSTELPELVSRELMVRSLARATGREDVQLVGDLRIERATGGVEGLLSLVLRVEVSYRFPEEVEQSHSNVFIVKRNPQSESQLELTKSIKVFDREGAYFEKVAPIMSGLAEGKVEVPLPDCFVAVYGGDGEAIVMEDLCEKGFRTSDHKYRVKGLDLPHCSLIMKRLGRLHALAVAAERSMPVAEGGWLKTIPELSRDPVFYEREPGDPPLPWMGMMTTALETLAYISKELDGLPKEVEASGMLDEIIRRTWPTICRLVKPDPRGHNLLNHGDCWMNNVMFRYEKNKSGEEIPVDAKFIDFQLFRDKHFDRLIVEYFETMAGVLEALDAGTPPLSLDELMVDLHGVYKTFGVVIGILYTPLLRLGDDFVPETAAEMTPEKYEEIIETGNSNIIRSRFANDPEFRSVMEDLVREFVEVAFPDGPKSLSSSPFVI